MCFRASNSDFFARSPRFVFKNLEKNETLEKSVDDSQKFDRPATDSNRWRRRAGAVLDTFESAKNEKNLNQQDFADAEKMLRTIPAEKLLKLNSKKLQKLFLDPDGKVNFHGHAGISQNLKLGDIFPEKKEIFFNGEKISVRENSDKILTESDRATEKVSKPKSEIADEVWSDFKNLTSLAKLFVDGGMTEKLFQHFRKIPASEFLEQGKNQPELLQQIFVKNGTVDFHKNVRAEQEIGLGDLFPASQNFLKITKKNGEVFEGKRSFKKNKIGYFAPPKMYLEIHGGEKIEEISAPEFPENFSKIQPAADEDALKTQFSEEVRDGEVREQKTRAEIEQILKTEGAGALEISSDPENRFFPVMERISKIVGEKYDLPWEVIFGQAALETGHGKHVVGNNFFGIKSGENWSGESFSAQTKEQNGQNFVSEIAAFRGYQNPFESAIGYAQFITKNARYADAVRDYRKNHDPQQFLVGIKSAGYATDADYVENVSGVYAHYFSDGVFENTDKMTA